MISQRVDMIHPRMRRRVAPYRQRDDDAASVTRDVASMNGPGTIVRRVLAPLLALLLSACGPAATPAPSPTPASHVVSGVLTLHNGDDFVKPDPGCQGTGGYSDIGPDTAITVRDGTGAIIATGRLDASPVDDAPARDCEITFSLTVPDAPFYTFEVSHRGELTYSRAELEAVDWTLSFTLGD
jgi:hypothetical protein